MKCLSDRKQFFVLGGLIDFISDIHVHFGNQRCAAVLSKARKLMKMDIHETVEVNRAFCAYLKITIYSNKFPFCPYEL